MTSKHLAPLHMRSEIHLSKINVPVSVGIAESSVMVDNSGLG